jgi:hypothetical protein
MDLVDQGLLLDCLFSSLQLAPLLISRAVPQRR